MVKKDNQRRNSRNKDSPYFDQSGDPIIRESGCIVADVLGFSEMIRSSTTANADGALLLQFFNILDKSVAQMEENKGWTLGSPQWTFKFYSDNLVIGFPLAWNAEDKSAESEIGRTLQIVAEHQLKLACAGFFVRGGLSYGNLHVSNNLVFGKAMLDAHEIESTVADYPRIVLHKSVLPKIDKHVSFGGSPHLSSLLIDDDGQIFLNYLDVTVPEPEAFYDDLLLTHKSNVLERLEEFKDNSRVYRKYVWLAKYHNFFCDNFVTQPYVRSNFDVKPFKIDHQAISGFRFLATRYAKKKRNKT